MRRVTWTEDDIQLEGWFHGWTTLADPDGQSVHAIVEMDDGIVCTPQVWHGASLRFVTPHAPDTLRCTQCSTVVYGSSSGFCSDRCEALLAGEYEHAAQAGGEMHECTQPERLGSNTYCACTACPDAENCVDSMPF